MLTLSAGFAHADPASSRVRIYTASWCSGCGEFERALQRFRGPDGRLRIRIRGEERSIAVDFASLDRADLFTLQSLRGRALPGIQLVSDEGAVLARREGGQADEVRAWIQQQLENSAVQELDWVPPVTTPTTGEWAGRTDEARAAMPTSPVAIPSKYRWIFEDTSAGRGVASSAVRASEAN